MESLTPTEIVRSCQDAVLSESEIRSLTNSDSISGVEVLNIAKRRKKKNLLIINYYYQQPPLYVALMEWQLIVWVISMKKISKIASKQSYS